MPLPPLLVYFTTANECLTVTLCQGSGLLLTLNFSSDSGGMYVDHVIIQEDQSKGQKVKLFVVEALQGGLWQVVANGHSIGHKSILALSPGD
jgi:hypothetical protein